MRITLFGTGYVGLVTGTCFAAAGNDVLCVDIDARARGACSMPESVRSTSRACRKRWFATSVPAVCSSPPTPAQASSTARCSSSASALPPASMAPPTSPLSNRSPAPIGQYMQTPQIVVNKSTVPVGTADRVEAIIATELRERGFRSISMSCPTPSSSRKARRWRTSRSRTASWSARTADRALEAMRELYAPFNRNHNRLMVMDVRSAEFTKYAANAMLATKISFMNEMANIAERIGVDIESVRVGIGSDPRIGYSFIYPGCGYGGSCFPKDVQSARAGGLQVGYDAQLLRAVTP